MILREKFRQHVHGDTQFISRITINKCSSYWKLAIITNILNAVALLQIKSCKSSQRLFKYPTKYLQNHIKSISTWSLSNHQSSKNFLNIRSVVDRNNILHVSSLLMHSACTVNAGFPSQCDVTIESERIEKFGTVGFDFTPQHHRSLLDSGINLRFEVQGMIESSRKRTRSLSELTLNSQTPVDLSKLTGD